MYLLRALDDVLGFSLDRLGDLQTIEWNVTTENNWSIKSHGNSITLDWVM